MDSCFDKINVYLMNLNEVQSFLIWIWLNVFVTFFILKKVSTDLLCFLNSTIWYSKEKDDIYIQCLKK